MLFIKCKNTVTPMHNSPQQSGKAPLLTVKQAAEFMGVSPKTVYAWVAQERLDCLRAGNRIRFRLCDLERWLGVRKEA